VFLRSNALVANTINNSRKIETVLSAGKHFVDSWALEYGRLPTADEFKAWSSKQQQLPGLYDPRELIFKTDNFPDDVIKKFGPPHPGSYLLSLWRGEWDEYYASWMERTSLVFQKSAYFVSGSALSDSAILAVAGICFLFAGRWLWRRGRPNHSLQPTAGRRVAHI
jgi:hypothetical protein